MICYVLIVWVALRFHSVNQNFIAEIAIDTTTPAYVLIHLSHLLP